jgi:hypothetical protein
MRLLPIPSLAFLVLSTVVPAFAQDLTIVSRVTHDGGPPETTASYISSDHARIAAGDGKEVIVDFKTGQMAMLDLKKKTYSVITRQDMDAFAARMQEQVNSPEMKKAQAEMKKAEEQIKNLPPEQRKQIEAMMGGMFAVDVQKTGTTRKVAGYTCENWTVTFGQISRSEECLTNDLKFPPQTWDMYRNYMASLQSMMTALGPMARFATKMFEDLKKMKGFPLAKTTTVDVMGHKSVTTSEVTEIKRSAISASAWEIPAGYTKVDNPMLKSLDRSGKK